MGEFDRIERLARRFGKVPAPDIGIGDDCAVIAAGSKPLALTVDASVEGVHFSRDVIALDVAAERAVEAAMSDLAAMGASVTYRAGSSCGILSAITVPAKLDDWEFEAIIEGIARAAERAGAKVLGGNLAAGPVVSLTTTVIGRVEGRAITRSGASVGDRLCVTGVVGAAAVGLRALASHAGEERHWAAFVNAWRSPRARLREGVAMAEFASAAIDVSDGLAQDLGHLCKASGCGVVIDLERLPMLPGQRDAAELLGGDGAEMALSGGEDYEVCFTCTGEPREAPAGSAGWTVIGEVVAGSGVSVRDARGVRRLDAKGWDHFEE